MKNELLFYANRHIYEIVLGFAFERPIESSVGQEISIFKKFQNFWSDLDNTRYVSGSEEIIVKRSFVNDKVVAPVKEKLLVGKLCC